MKKLILILMLLFLSLPPQVSAQGPVVIPCKQQNCNNNVNLYPKPQPTKRNKAPKKGYIPTDLRRGPRDR